MEDFRTLGDLFKGHHGEKAWNVSMNPYDVQLCIAEQIFKHRCSLGQGIHYTGREQILWGLVSDIVDGESYDMWIERVV